MLSNTKRTIKSIFHTHFSKTRTWLSFANSVQYKTYFQIDFSRAFQWKSVDNTQTDKSNDVWFSLYVYELNGFPNTISYHTWTALVSRLRTAGVESISTIHRPFLSYPPVPSMWLFTPIRYMYVGNKTNQIWIVLWYAYYSFYSIYKGRVVKLLELTNTQHLFQACSSRFGKVLPRSFKNFFYNTYMILSRRCQYHQ